MTKRRMDQLINVVDPYLYKFTKQNIKIYIMERIGLQKNKNTKVQNSCEFKICESKCNKFHPIEILVNENNFYSKKNQFTKVFYR